MSAHGFDPIEHAKCREIRQMETGLLADVRLTIALAKAVISKTPVVPGDFSPEEQAIYTKLKNFSDNYS